MPSSWRNICKKEGLFKYWNCLKKEKNMKKLIEAIINKFLCCHEWGILKTTEYEDCFVHLLCCKKCGKLKKKRL